MISAATRQLLWQKREHLLKAHGPSLGDLPRVEHVERMLVVLGASRSGSSLLFRLLSSCTDFVAPLGEENPFYRLSGLMQVNRLQDSDAIEERALSMEQAGRIASGLLADLGMFESPGGNSLFPAEDYALDCSLRLMLQWPLLDFDPEWLYRSARDILSKSKTDSFDATHFWCGWISALQENGFAVDPGFYDLTPRELPRSAPPGEFLEEPPFIVPLPRTRARAQDLKGRQLLLKSSSNCYRVGILKRLFPKARIQYLVLTRNPAGSISGLMDGWLSPAFHSHRVGHLKALNIGGYSSGQREGSHDWWKFDLPPGWSEVAQSPLEEVCGFQWSSANRRLTAIDGHRAKYERLLDPGGLKEEIRGILEYSEADPDSLRWPVEIPVVMNVRPPRGGKWLERRDRILALLHTREISRISADFGYDLGKWEDLP